MGYHLLALLLALLLPLALFVSRSVVRRQRSAIYLDVVRSLFPEDHLPQLDLIGAKYDAPDRFHDIQAPRRMTRESMAIYLAAAIFVALSFAGFELLFYPIDWLIAGKAGDPRDWSLPLREAFFWTSGGGDLSIFRNTVAIIAVAFLGGYVAVARFLVRQALNYELDGLSFVRSILLVIMGMVIAMVAYRSLINGYENTTKVVQAGHPVVASPATSPSVQGPNVAPPVTPIPTGPLAPGGAVAAPSSGSATPATPAPPQGAKAAATIAQPPSGPGAPAGWWIGLAFLLGYSPEAGLSWISRRLRLSLQKNIDTNLLHRVSVVPVEIIDGIDAEIAYRLDQLNIEDVQNLATANPIQLYIEAPYGLYEVFDWVLQAQLCLVTGPRAFLALKRHGIRTIFDMERAVLADGVPDSYVQAVGEVLFGDADPKFRALVGPNGGAITADLVRHAVAVTGDDLHVHRLRTLWLRIQERSWPANEHQGEWIYRRGPLPGDPDYGVPPTEAEAWLEMARFWGRRHAAARSDGAPVADVARFRDEALAAVRRTLAADPTYKRRLQVLWDSGTAAAGPRDLSSLFDDAEFKALLADGIEETPT